MTNLEHFPTSETAQRMMSRISPIYENSYVAKWLFQVMGEEMGDARLRFEEIKAQVTPTTATWGLPYWESRYDITPDPSQTLAERQRAVDAKRSSRAPMSPARIEQIIGSLTGKTVLCSENVGPYTFHITIFDDSNDLNIEAIYSKLKRIKPSHQTVGLTVVPIITPKTVRLLVSPLLAEVGTRTEIREMKGVV